MGHMGFVRARMLPYNFELAAYNTPIGVISEIIETPYGFHIVKPVATRQSKGLVLVEHIMKLPPSNANEEQN